MRFSPAWVAPLLLSANAFAETAVRETSCAEAQQIANDYQACVVQWGPWANLFCIQNNITQCWDFEAGGMGAWTTTGTAFATQPTVGDNVTAWRVLQSKASPFGGTMEAEIRGIGGDYWQTPYSIGNQGVGWIGTYENRNSSFSALGVTQGDAPTGTATSPEFIVDRDYISFLVGGGCDWDTERVELQVLEPPTQVCRPNKLGGTVCSTWPAMWWTASNSEGWIGATGSCNEELVRKSFSTANLMGRRARVVITDNSSGAWGHINVDHIIHTLYPPGDLNGANIPLWGLADTHAHPDSENAFRSIDGGTHTDGHVFHGSVGTLTTTHTTLENELSSCDNAGHDTLHGGRVVIEGIEKASLGSTPHYPLGCNPGDDAHTGSTCSYYSRDVNLATSKPQQHWGQGVVPVTPGSSDLVGWPYWYTRAHQQMHLTWIRRAYLGGQRLMVAAATNNEALSATMRDDDTGVMLSDFGALRRFKNNMTKLADNNKSWMEIAKSPADARRIIRSNKLAIVLATEVDDLGDHCAKDFSSTADWDPADEAKTTTTTTYGGDPWNQLRDRTNAASCTTAAEWRTRVDNLYKAGYRVIMPVHLADNNLGGTAIYDEKWNTNTFFMTGAFTSVLLSTLVQWTYPEDVRNPNSTNQPILGWSNLGNIVGVAMSSPAPMFAHVPYAYAPGLGFVNMKPLTANGLAVVAAIREHGMILDLAHLDQFGREQILGIGNYATSSPLSSGCDMNTAACQATAYPAISSHAGLRELQPPRDAAGGGTNEGGLTAAMITRIRDIGGTIGVGVSAGDAVTANVASPQPAGGIYTQTVDNNCGGSTRSFAQSYLYALKKMSGKGVTLGTDVNGLEDRLNPRFGTQGCYARGNVPWSVHIGSDNVTTLVNDWSPVPFRYRPGILGAGGTAGAQRAMQKNSSQGLNYAHYAGTPPSGGRFSGLLDPPNYISNLIGGNISAIVPTPMLTTTSMNSLSSLPALTASTTGNRTFDYNYDGLAHYGMLPDMLQDARVVGLAIDQVAPLFQGAEAVVQTWERGCRMSATGCQ